MDQSTFPAAKIVKPAAVEIDPTKTALVVVDMQNDYCAAEGKQYIGPMARKVVPRIGGILQRARELDMKVIHTQTWYDRDDPRFSNHPKAAKAGGGCMAGTWGAEFVDGLRPKRGEPVIRKASFDPFFGTDFDDVLRKMNHGTFVPGSVHRNRAMNDSSTIVVGVVSNVCVDKAVFGLYNRGYEVVVPEDCVGAKDEFDQAWALFQFKKSYKALITSSQLLTIRATKQAPASS